MYPLPLPRNQESIDQAIASHSTRLLALWNRLLNSKRGDCEIDQETEINLKCDMLDRMDQGWLDNEIYRMIRNTEYFDNVSPEGICLQRMRQVRADVEERLHLNNLFIDKGSK